ncbi:MAG: ABC transporter ATP-binding protein [Legionella longbeachae]|nr:ABC transporter ATP-binding protein [Legionella longbeachae]
MIQNKHNRTPSVLNLLFDYMRQHKKSTFFFVAFGLFWAFTLPYMSYLFGVIIDRIKTHGLESVSVYSFVLVPLCLYVSIHVLRSIGYYASGLFSLLSIPAYKSEMVNNLFSHLGKQSIDYFEAKKSGFLSNKVMNACIGLEPVIVNLFFTIFPQSLAILITGILLSTVIPYFGIVLWGWGVTIILYTYQSAKVGQMKASTFAESCSVFNGHIVDIIGNVPSVIHNAAFDQETKLLKQNMNDLIDKERLRNRHANKVMFLQHLAMNALVAFYLIGSIIGYKNHLVSIGEVVFVMTAVTAIAGLTSSLGNCFLEFIYNIGLLKDGLNLLTLHPDVADTEDASSHRISKGNIEIKNINFSYPSQQPVFKNFSLSIHTQQKIGIVGSSGAGKTTLMKLIMRLYDINEGSIEIDGIDLVHFTMKSLRSQIAIVPQHLNLFHRSIFENIAYGCGQVSKEEVIAAAKKAKCHDFISSLEHQYDTIIGEQGVKLSGGQRQRIAIARAILKNTPILLFDEATSALDSATEQAIHEALETLLEDKTALIIAHRLSTLKAMDKIIVLENGQIIESGTHNELLAIQGAYYNYWTHQSSGFIK